MGCITMRLVLYLNHESNKCFNRKGAGGCNERLLEEIVRILRRADERELRMVLWFIRGMR